MSGFAAVTPSGIGDGSLRIIQTTENRILGLKGIILAAYASVIDSAFGSISYKADSSLAMPFYRPIAACFRNIQNAASFQKTDFPLV
jgi:hypothetical protein